MKTLLLVAAHRSEYRGLLRHLSPALGLQWPVEFSMEARVSDGRWLLVANGTGPARAGEAADVARAREAFQGVVSLGFCGALDPGLRPGDVFVARRVSVPEEAASYETEPVASGRAHATGVLVSLDRIVDTIAGKQELREAGGDAVEMEAAGLARRAVEWNVPLYCVRAVTDTAGEEFVTDLNWARDARGRIRNWKVVASALRRPARGLTELFRLRRRSRLAAIQLGDFLADCRF